MLALLIIIQSLDGISDIRDESDRSGMRIVIEVWERSSAVLLFLKFSNALHAYDAPNMGWPFLFLTERKGKF